MLHQELTRLVEAITKKGGAAVANSDGILEGDKIIQAAVAAYGTVHILINTANITSQLKRFEEIDDAEWSGATERSIKGTYKARRAP